MTGSALSPLVERMLGKPFAWLGHGPDAYYCLGVFLRLLRDHSGIELDDPFLKGEDDALRGFFHRFLELPVGCDVQPLDLFFTRRGPQRQAHVFTVESPRWTVSIDELWGVQRIPTEEARRKSEKLYRLKELVA